jgi:probable rRNA maturation factor
VRAALGADHAGAELSVRIVDEPEMRELNARYRHKDYPTNVLSFPAGLPPGVDVPLLGDIVICAPLVTREAAEQHKAPRAHWAHLLVHGTLHLLGHDHERARDAEVMEALERRILAGLKFPDPYREQ